MNENGSVVVARDVTRRYGEGETAVDALRGVSRRGAAGRARRRHGAVGLGQVDADAHPRRARQADLRDRDDRRHGDHDRSTTRELTKLRRDHIGFVFQFFNLLPMLTAEENILPAALDRRREARQGAGSTELIDSGRARRPPARTGRPSSPAASSSASRSRARSSRARRSCSPTSRRATSTRRRAPRSSSCCATRSTSLGQTTVMVTHDAARRRDRRPRAVPRRRPDRRASSPSASQPRSSRRWTRSPLDDPVALKGLLGRKLRTALTAVAIVLGVAMVSGTFVLTDSIDKAFDSIFTRRLPEHRRDDHRQVPLRAERRLGTSAPTFDESLLAEGAARCRTSSDATAASRARRS